MSRNSFLEELLVNSSTFNEVTEPYIYNFLNEVTNEELEKNYVQIEIVTGALLYMLSHDINWMTNGFFLRMLQLVLNDTEFGVQWQNRMSAEVDSLTDKNNQQKYEIERSRVETKRLHALISKLTEDNKQLQNRIQRGNSIPKVEGILSGTIQQMDSIFNLIEEYGVSESVEEFKTMFKKYKKKVIKYVACFYADGKLKTIPLAVLVFDESDYECLTYTSFVEKYPHLQYKNNYLNDSIWTKDALIYLSTKEAEARVVLSEKFGESSNPKILMNLAEDWQKRLTEIRKKFSV